LALHKKTTAQGQYNAAYFLYSPFIPEIPMTYLGINLKSTFAREKRTKNSFVTASAKIKNSHPKVLLLDSTIKNTQRL